MYSVHDIYIRIGILNQFHENILFSSQKKMYGEEFK